MTDLLYLGAADIAALKPAPAQLRSTLARSFLQHGRHSVWTQPKQTLAIAPGHFFQAMCAASPDPPYAAAKWVGVAAANSERGLANVDGLVVLSDLETGQPLAIIDGNSLTVLRTAAMSGLAAEHLARRDSMSIGFVGCGQQAHGHLEALRDVLPGLTDVVCLSRSAGSARALADAARGLGLRGRETTSPGDVLACDVVVTTVPGAAGLTPFLDATELRPGSFVSAVDLGRSWRSETFGAFDTRIVDDNVQAQDPANRSKLAYPGPFDADLAMLVGGTAPGRTDPAQRILFLFPGFALADLAVASELFVLAMQNGRGTLLKR